MYENVKPQLHPQFTYSAFAVGRDKTPVLLIDNFLLNAELLVDYCADNTDFNNADTSYPGLRMMAPALYTQAMFFYLGNLFEAVFHLPTTSIEGARSLYSIVVTPPEAMQPQQCLPHVDSVVTTDLACVHFLCDSTKGGTSFYRHKKTGYETLNSESVAHYNQTVIDEGAFNSEKKSYMNGSNDYFERIIKIDAAFNRMIVYPSHVLHSGNISSDFAFDPNPRTGRLTLNSFIYGKRS